MPYGFVAQGPMQLPTVVVTLDTVVGFNTDNASDIDRSITVGNGATLLLGITGSLNATGFTTMTWDPLGTLPGGNQAMTLLTSVLTGDAANGLRIYGLLNPAPGSSIVRGVGSPVTRLSLAAASYKNTRVDSLANAVPTGNRITGASGGVVDDWGVTDAGPASLTIPFGYMGLILNKFSNGISSTGTWTGATHTDGVWANCGMAVPSVYASPLVMGIDSVTPDDFAAGISILIAPGT